MMIFSLVTADQSSAAAESIVPYLADRHIFLDGNSVSPGTKRHNAGLIAPSRACYIDLAIMAPILPRGHRTPMLVAGPRQERIAELLEQLDFDFPGSMRRSARPVSLRCCAPVLIKGLNP